MISTQHITTLTLNPAIDWTITVPTFTVGELNRVESDRMDAGGKGINVARFLAQSGFSVTATGFLGLENVDSFNRLFNNLEIEDRTTKVPGRTRSNLKIINKQIRQITEINFSGFQVSEKDLSELLAGINDLIEKSHWFVLSGSLPPGIPDGVYGDLVRLLREKGKRVALDASGSPLREGVESIPEVIKPNIHELRELTGEPLENEVEIRHAVESLLEKGIRNVIVSMGERGALFVDEQTSIFALPPRVEINQTVGAGDALVAGFIAGQCLNLDLEEVIRLSMAFAASAVSRTEADLPEWDHIQALKNEVQLRDMG